MPSELELCVMSQQLDALRAFAARLPLLGAEAEIERFLCHHDMLSDSDWQQVLAYNASVPPPPFEIRSPIDEYRTMTSNGTETYGKPCSISSLTKRTFNESRGCYQK